MPYVFDQKIETEKYTIEIDNTEKYGYFENKISGTSGGLWFDEQNMLVDCDGVCELPKQVKEVLKTRLYPDMEY